MDKALSAQAPFGAGSNRSRRNQQAGFDLSAEATMNSTTLAVVDSQVAASEAVN